MKHPVLVYAQNHLNAGRFHESRHFTLEGQVGQQRDITRYKSYYRLKKQVGGWKHTATLYEDIGVRARGLGAAAPNSGKTIILGQKVNFSGRSQQPKMEKYLLCVY